MGWSKRRWRKVLIWTASVAAVLAAVVVAALALTPTIVRSQVAAAAEKVWDGQLEIRDLRLGTSSPLRVEGVELIDSKGRTWLTVGSIALHLRDWPSLHPVLEEVEINQVTVTAYFDEGRCELPLTLTASDEPSEPSPYVDLQRVSVRNISLLSHSEDDTAWGHFQWRQKPGLEEVAMERESAAFWPIALNHVEVNEVFYRDEALEIRSFRTGPDVAGDVRGLARMQFAPEGPPRIRATTSIEDLPLACLTGRPVEEHPGELKARYVFRMEDGKATGRGTLLLVDADVWLVPVLSDVLRAIDISADVVALSDVRMDFETSDAVVTLKRLELANRISALRAEPGGTINLATGEVDLHVVTAPLKEVSDVLARVPVVSLFVDLGDKLTRLHVTGRWDVEDEIKIRKKPLDVVEGPAEFFVGVARTGGDLGKGLGKGLEELRKALE